MGEDSGRSLRGQKPFPADTCDVGGMRGGRVDREGGDGGTEDPRRVDGGERVARAEYAGKACEKLCSGRAPDLSGRPRDQGDGAGVV